VGTEGSCGGQVNTHTPTELEVAYHEAGHVIAAASLLDWCLVGDVSIVPGKTLGSCFVAEKCTCTGELCTCMVKFTAIDLAGGLAQFMQWPSRFRGVPEIAGDCEFITKRLAADDVTQEQIESEANALITGETCTGMLAESVRLAKTVLSHRWAHVIALAYHLIKVKQMSRAETHKYLSARKIGVPPWAT
jgi:hypothetical protein